MSGRRRGDGFTLIEVLAVVFLTSIVLAAAVSFYVNLSRASQGASDKTRSQRLATAVADRVARDLATAYLVVKPEEVDPLEHPWLFLAERGDGSLGADRLKFTMRGHRPRGSDARESDLAMVAYLTRPTPEGLELWRWTSPHLPEGLDRELPRPEDEGTQLLADGLADFGVRVMDDLGEWTDVWDSSLLERSSQLPTAAEVIVSVPSTAVGDADAFDDPTLTVRHQVMLPVRPVDLAQLLRGEESLGDGEGDEEDGESDADCVTVAQCAAQNRAAADAAYGAAVVDTFIQTNGDLCAADIFGEANAAAWGCQ